MAARLRTTQRAHRTTTRRCANRVYRAQHSTSGASRPLTPGCARCNLDGLWRHRRWTRRNLQGPENLKVSIVAKPDTLTCLRIGRHKGSAPHEQSPPRITFASARWIKARAPLREKLELTKLLNQRKLAHRWRDILRTSHLDGQRASHLLEQLSNHQMLQRLFRRLVRIAH